MSFAAQLDLLCCHSAAATCVAEDEIRGGAELNDSASCANNRGATTSEESANDDSNERFATGDAAARHAIRHSQQQLLPFAALLSPNDSHHYAADRPWHHAMLNGQNALGSRGPCANGTERFDHRIEGGSKGRHGFMDLCSPVTGLPMGCLSDPCLAMYGSEEHQVNGGGDEAGNTPARRKRCAPHGRMMQYQYGSEPSQGLPAIYGAELASWQENAVLFPHGEGGSPAAEPWPERAGKGATAAATVWPYGSMKLAQVMSDLQTQQRGVAMTCDEVDLQLPRSVINKLVKDAAGRIRVSAEAREVIINCCHEFVRVLGALANLSCEENKKKLIGPDHIIAALGEMGMQSFCASCLDIMNTIQEEAAQKRKRVTLCYDGDGSTVDRLLKEQQELFQQARKEQCLLEDGGESSDESLKDENVSGRTVVIHGVKHQLPAFRPVVPHDADHKEDDDYD